MAQRLLDRERADATDVDGIAAAGVRLFEKTFAQLAPLLGAAGVEAIFRRSVRLTQPAFPCLALDGAPPGRPPDPARTLRDCLAQQDPARAAETAIALYARFLGLVATFIGERLAYQVIRRAWPDMDEDESRPPTEDENEP